MRETITASDLQGLPGLHRAARDEILRRQPATVKEALAIPYAGRQSTRHLLDLGLITDPEGVQNGIGDR
jgi:hypothetical protein